MAKEEQRMDLSLCSKRLPKLFTEGSNNETLNNLIPLLKRERYGKSAILSFLIHKIPEAKEHLDSSYPLFLGKRFDPDLILSLIGIEGIKGDWEDLPTLLLQLYNNGAKCTILSPLILPPSPSNLSPALALLDAVVCYECPELEYSNLKFERDRNLCLDTGLSLPSSSFKRKHLDPNLGFMSDSEVLFLKVQTHLLGGNTLEKANKALSLILREGRGKRYIDLEELKEVNSTTTGKKAYTDHERRYTCNQEPFFLYIKRSLERLPVIEAKPDKPPKVKDPKDKTRKKIKEPVRIAVWKAHCGDKLTGLCFCCDVALSFQSWECGHIIADAEGGAIEPDNLRPLCLMCNRSMGKQNMYEYIRENKLPGMKRLPA